MKSPAVLKKINGSYHRRLLPTEILQKGDRYLNGESVNVNLGLQAVNSAAYNGPYPEHLWRPMPQIEGYRQLDLSDTAPQDGKLFTVTKQGCVDGPFNVSNCFAFFSSRPTVAAALRNASVSSEGDILFYAKIEPKIATGHNPDNLTEEQVGAGYRLLLPSEIGFRKATSEIQLWRISDARWIESSYNGDTAEFTYRVRNGVKLAPAKAAPAPDASAPTTEVGTNERLKKLEEAVEALKFTVELQAKAITSLQGRLDKGGRALKG